MGGRGRLGILAGMLSLTLAVAACGGAAESEEPAESEAAGSSASDPSAGAGSSGSTDDGLGDLAEQAESEAGKLPSSDPASRKGQVLGADISWPQCPKGMGIKERRSEGMPMPLDSAEYVVIGLTNGPAFTPNPCLADQVDWAVEEKLMAAAYSVLSYPTKAQLTEHGGTGPYDGDTKDGALHNVGFQQAAYNVANLRKAGLQTPIVWLDVEPVTIWEWSDDLAANAAVIEGAARGYRKAGYQIGVYSTPHMWSEIVGDFEMSVPEWRAAGDTSRAEALHRCGKDWSIQGGQAVLGQWLEDRRDLNLTCPGIAADLGHWFHQY